MKKQNHFKSEPILKSNQIKLSSAKSNQIKSAINNSPSNQIKSNQKI